ncbi:MAG: hypothetical protein LBG20_01840 [Holosporaceae bacterium]|jgi:hypothetical protein|nr:hypothetical protein [Holosporaceae bacterium]
MDEEQLEQLNTSQLREIVLAICAQHKNVSKNVERMVVEKSHNSKEMISIIKKEITALKNRTSSFFSNKKTQEIITMFDQLCDFILSLSDTVPIEAFNLMKNFFEIHQVFFQKNNYCCEKIRPVFRNSCLMFGKIAERANIPSKDAASVIFSLFINDISNLHFSLISGFANILNGSDLSSLRSKIVAYYNSAVFEDVAKQEKDLLEIAFQDRGFKVLSGMSSEQCLESAKNKVMAKIRLWLMEIADCQNNVDDYIAALAFPKARCNKSLQDSEKKEIVSRLIAVGRGEDALEWIRTSNNYICGYPEWLKFEIDALEISNKSSEAQEKRLIWFQKELTLDSYEEVIQHMDEKSRAKIKKELVQCTVASDKVWQAVTLLAEIGSLEECSLLVKKNVNGLEKQLKSFDAHAVAKALQNDYPLSAVLLYRMLVVEALSGGSESKNANAVKDLILCEQLSSRVVDFNGFPRHVKYLDFLRQRYKKANRFWEKVNAAKKKLEKK